MNNEIGLLVSDIPQDDVDVFVKNIKANIDIKKVVHKVEIDYSWVDVLDESVPYLDNIIRNPRRFIVNEEDVVPIEKTKRVSEESIKHLAVHTNLIQDVDEDGIVKPLKLLNVFREETIDLYENRFAYSLITNLYTFVREQLTYKEQSVDNKDEKYLKYEASTTYKGQDVSVSIDLVSKNRNGEETDEEVLNKREDKIKHIKEILEDFMGSKFMKMMSNATPVRSPIRKTNVILKDQNFVKALELWEFLESYQVKKPVIETDEEKDLNSVKKQKELGMSYFLNYCILNDIVTKKGELKSLESINLLDSIFEYAKDLDHDEKEFRKIIEQKLNEASHFKNIQKNEARKVYRAFIENHRCMFSRAITLFK